MAFLPFLDDVGSVDETLESGILANSVTVQVGEAVRRMTAGTGFITNGAAGAPLTGIVAALVQGPSGAPIPPATFAAGSAYSTVVTSVASAADNQTSGARRALVNMSMRNRYSVNLNGTIGTTVNSDRPGVRIDLDSAAGNYDRLLESSATRTATAVRNFAGYGSDPNDSTRMIVSIALSDRVSNN